jgi:hypothetical protein
MVYNSGMQESWSADGKIETHNTEFDVTPDLAKRARHEVQFTTMLLNEGINPTDAAGQAELKRRVDEAMQRKEASAGNVIPFPKQNTAAPEEPEEQERRRA